MLHTGLYTVHVQATLISSVIRLVHWTFHAAHPRACWFEMNFVSLKGMSVCGHDGFVRKQYAGEKSYSLHLLGQSAAPLIRYPYSGEWMLVNCGMILMLARYGWQLSRCLYTSGKHGHESSIGISKCSRLTLDPVCFNIPTMCASANPRVI